MEVLSEVAPEESPLKQMTKFTCCGEREKFESLQLPTFRQCMMIEIEVMPTHCTVKMCVFILFSFSETDGEEEAASLSHIVPRLMAMFVLSSLFPATQTSSLNERY